MRGKIGDKWERKCIEAAYSICAETFQIPKRKLRSASRCAAHIALARQTAMYLSHTVCSINLTRIASVIGRDRSTVAYACGKIEDKRDEMRFDLLVDIAEARLRREVEILKISELIDFDKDKYLGHSLVQKSAFKTGSCVFQN